MEQDYVHSESYYPDQYHVFDTERIFVDDINDREALLLLDDAS